MTISPKAVSSGAGLAAVVYLSAFCSAESAQAVDNRDVFLLASEVADDTELIREVMGRPYDDSPRLPASEVSHRELYFQAQTLFRKANQLAQDFEMSERRSAPPAPADREIQAADVYAVVESAFEEIGRVKGALGIEEQLEPLRRETEISATGVFMTIIDVNRQLNLMLAEPIRARDVFEQVSLAVSYGAGILSSLEVGGKEWLSAQSFDGHKRPADIYGQLLECIDLVSRIARRVDVSVLSLSSRRNIPDDIEPGHVYDIATILVADLATLAIALDADGIDPGLPTPQRIFPTQVYERSGVLQRQLELIDRLL